MTAPTHPGVEFTATERALLRRIPQHIGHCISSPEHGIAYLRDGHLGGGGGEFTTAGAVLLHYQCTRTAIEGQWHDWIPVAWAGPDDIRPTGTPIMFREGALLREARVSYTRLHRWCESLPADVRAQATVRWRTYPTNSRDIGALVRLTLQQLADPAPATELTLFNLQEPAT
ncbi:hypothetical protein [Nocardia sp. NPDC005745]|uniref:hypothetical protein n=1 Tax=Nocardia sp. NPDC005745 TaxID=3157061 RepID=UPI0033F64F6B